jgi:hypothetical protein
LIGFYFFQIFFFKSLLFYELNSIIGQVTCPPSLPFSQHSRKSREREGALGSLKIQSYSIIYIAKPSNSIYLIIYLCTFIKNKNIFRICLRTSRRSDLFFFVFGSIHTQSLFLLLLFWSAVPTNFFSQQQQVYFWQRWKLLPIVVFGLGVN